MIETCSVKSMIIALAVLIGASILILLLEDVFAVKATNHKRPENGSLDCWETENFTIIEPCKKCTNFEMKVQAEVCSETGYREKVHCKKEGDVYRSCDGSRNEATRKFWIFEACAFCVGVVAIAITVIRERQMHRQTLERIQKQIGESLM